MSTERNMSPAPKTSLDMFAIRPKKWKSSGVQILLLACPQRLNIHPRLQQLMTTAASKGAFLVDFSVVLQELLYRGGMAAGLAYPLVEQREQCLVAKSMGLKPHTKTA